MRHWRVNAKTIKVQLQAVMDRYQSRMMGAVCQRIFILNSINPGIELILTRLHAGGKFRLLITRFLVVCMAWGFSVVNALSTRVEVTVWRDSTQFEMAFENGAPVTPLTETVGSISVNVVRKCIFGRMAAF